MKLKFYLLLILTFSLIGCKSKVEEGDVITPAEELFQKGNELLDKKSYKEAAETFSKIYYQHPGSTLTPKAEIKEAYAYYEAGEYEDAIDVLENFAKLHPLHEEIEYAYYLRALAYYKQIPNIYHDQDKTSKAKQAIEQLIFRFPSGKYVKEMYSKLDFANNQLAAHEMDVGRFYLKQKNLIGAIKRFETVINEYKNTSQIAEALYRLVESYIILGLNQEAKKYAAVLERNYPESEWSKYSSNLKKAN